MNPKVVKDEWETPQWMFDKLNEVFKFDIDLCASGSNHKCGEWVDDLENAGYDLLKSPYNSAFMNPPFSKEKIRSCIEKALSLNFKTLVMVLPLDPTTKWFKYIIKSATSFDPNDIGRHEIVDYSWVKSSKDLDFSLLGASCYYYGSHHPNTVIHILPQRVKFEYQGKPYHTSRGPICIVVVRN